ncbi:MAG: hypothetical protein LBU99_07430 [Spirochaetaceae bacterium]|nr:hypothetical protein [Spirochaetaceae bacterium]
MKKSIFAITLLCVIAASSYGEIILFRPHSSIGYLSSDEVKGFAARR